MGKMFDKLMNTMRLNGDDYEEEYDDPGYDDADYEDDDTYEDEVEEQPALRKKTAVKKTETTSFTAAREKSIKSTRNSSGRSNNIVPIKTTQNIQEVHVVRPGNYDTAREIIDVLLEGQAAIVNLEGISYELSEKITDFIFGGCYALDGNIQKVNDYILIITPNGLEITGDIQSLNKKTYDSPLNYQAR